MMLFLSFLLGEELSLSSFFIHFYMKVEDEEYVDGDIYTFRSLSFDHFFWNKKDSKIFFTHLINSLVTFNSFLINTPSDLYANNE